MTVTDSLVVPENPSFASVMMLFGFGLGIAENCLVVSLFGSVAAPGQYPLTAETPSEL